MSVVKNIILSTLFVSVFPCASNALEYNLGGADLKLTGYGTVGMIEPEFEVPVFIGDWRVRAQLGTDLSEISSFGIVYALDATAVDKGNWSREAFGFFDIKSIGRIELGFTDSVARKLGLGLPDVGGLRINDRPLYNEKITPSDSVIADTGLTSGRGNSLRMNLVSVPISSVQYGVSVAGITDNYDWAVDAGLKIRRPSGKVKTAYSVGLSFMNRPDDFDNEIYTPGVTADWRAQMSMGMNLQYNSWIWGLTGRVIYDQDPIGEVSDGFAVGTGVSYDLLKYNVSLTYMLSDTGVWQDDVADFIDNTVVASFRYKYSENVDFWMSGGVTSTTPFISAGLRLVF